jgi:hypothetical protein
VRQTRPAFNNACQNLQTQGVSRRACYKGKSEICSIEKNQHMISPHEQDISHSKLIHTRNYIILVCKPSMLIIRNIKLCTTVHHFTIMQCKNTSLAKTGNLTRGVAVEGKLVESAAGETGDLALVGQSNDAGTESSGGLLALEGEEVGSKTGNVGGSHRGSRDGVLNIC